MSEEAELLTGHRVTIFRITLTDVVHYPEFFNAPDVGRWAWMHDEDGYDPVAGGPFASKNLAMANVLSKISD